MNSPRKTGLDALVELTCADWCLGHGYSQDGEPRTMFDVLPLCGTITAEAFALAAFEVSGIDPEAEPMWERAKQDIVKGFRDYLGQSEIDASEIQWRFDDGAPRHLPLPDPEAFRRRMTDEELLAEIQQYQDSREAILSRRELGRRHGLWDRLKKILGRRSPY